jgi:hypothetical protein
MDWDDAYANGAHIANAADYPPRWLNLAQEFRGNLGKRAVLDIEYGASPRERLDLFMPTDDAEGLVVFVHGGFWRAFEKVSWSHLAAGAVARGWVVAMPSYTLCPVARIPTITKQIGQAVAYAANQVPGPIRLVGHSAGGHLVSRMICEDTPLRAEVLHRIAHTVSISGLHDLRALLNTRLNEDLRLDADEAVRESPALLTPIDGARITCWVGSDERPEFLRQNALLANIWTGLGATTYAIEEPKRHHFNVIDGLSDPDSLLMDAVLG